MEGRKTKEMFLDSKCWVRNWERHLMKVAKKNHKEETLDAIPDSCPESWWSYFLESATIKMQCTCPFLAMQCVKLSTKVLRPTFLQH